MIIPMNISELYNELRDSQPHFSFTATFKDAADAIQWAVAEALELEHRVIQYQSPFHACAISNCSTDWLIEADRRLSELVEESKDG